jgi:hypothetical protein
MVRNLIALLFFIALASASSPATEITELKIELFTDDTDTTPATNNLVAIQELLLLPQRQIASVELNKFFVLPKETDNHKDVIYHIQVLTEDLITLTMIQSRDVSGSLPNAPHKIERANLIQIAAKSGEKVQITEDGSQIGTWAKVTFKANGTLPAVQTKLTTLDSAFNTEYHKLRMGIAATEFTKIKVELYREIAASGQVTEKPLDESIPAEKEIIELFPFGEITEPIELHTYFVPPKANIKATTNTFYRFEVSARDRITLNSVQDGDIVTSKLDAIDHSKFNRYVKNLENGQERDLSTNTLPLPLGADALKLINTLKPEEKIFIRVSWEIQADKAIEPTPGFGTKLLYGDQTTELNIFGFALFF